MKWLDRLKNGLSKTSCTLVKALTHTKLDAKALDEIEEALLLADISAAVASKIISELSLSKFDKQVSNEEVRKFIADKLTDMLAPAVGKIEISSKPHVILLCGVNGNGKTTTAGKLAAQYKERGKKVVMAACDTFRAAAVEQLEVWGERVGCQIISGAAGSDPASVAYKAIESARAEGADVLIIDTAGRLHNKANLMEELNKIVRVIKKVDDSAPHDTVIVVDATTGQNAISQVDIFNKAVNLTGVIITKLDGTAKGGVVVSVADKFSIPIVAIGVGEAIEDLNPFSAASYANSLMDI